MSDITTAIKVVRESVAAILHLHVAGPEKIKSGKAGPPKVEASLKGTAFCIAADRYLITAQHIFNSEKPRDPNDKFYAFTVPHNGPEAFAFPVVAFPIERRDIDLAVIELGPCLASGVHLPAISVTFANQPDGTPVLTVGFPSPEIMSIDADAQLNYKGGRFFLKSHANQGIISAQYTQPGAHLYELNVGWHHGESGGPIVALTDPPAAISLMQHYRNIKSPHGIVAGPHRGHSLAVIQQELISLGATVI